MNEIVAGMMTGQQVADMLGITLRHTRRILARFQREGAAAQAHGNRGRTPVNKLDEPVETVIVRLDHGEYREHNDSHVTGELAEWYEIQVSLPTIRRIRPNHSPSFAKNE